MPAAEANASPYRIQVRDLVRKPGTHRTHSSVFPAPAVVGSDVIGVPEGSDITLELSVETVTEGIWVSGTVAAEAAGECGRCLDPVREAVSATVAALYVYPDAEAEGDEDSVDLHEFDGDTLELEDVVRDAVVTSLPFTPLCGSDCPGLCDQCGARLADDPDHEHDVVDPRWSALQDLTEKKES